MATTSCRSHSKRPDDVAAHLAEPDHDDVHVISLPTTGSVSTSPASTSRPWSTRWARHELVKHDRDEDGGVDQIDGGVLVDELEADGHGHGDVALVEQASPEVPPQRRASGCNADAQDLRDQSEVPRSRSGQHESGGDGRRASTVHRRR